MGSFTSGIGGLISGFGGGEMITGRNLLADPFGDVQAAEAQAQAQKDALAQQERLAAEARATFLAQSELGREDLRQANEAAQGDLRSGRDSASRYLDLGLYDAAGSLRGGADQSLASLGAAYGAGRSDLSQGYGQAQGSLAQGRGDIRGALGQYDVTQAQDRMGRMLDQPGGLYGGFEQDPGYKFRQQQGEDAINRAASARGGRLSGRTLQDLGEFNQGLASQAYNEFAGRRQAELGAAAGSDAQRAALLQAQAGRTDTAGRSLADIMSQSSGLQAQQGQGLSGLSVGLGQQQAGIYGQQGQQLAALYGQHAGQQAQNQQQAANALSGANLQTGSNLANVAIGVGGNAQGNANNLMGAYQNYAQYGGMAQQAQANSNRETAGMIASFFSDARLKSEIEQISGSKYERVGLKGYRWKWNKIADKLYGLRGDGEGVIAQEVERLYPACVAPTVHGHLVVKYSELDRMIETAPVLPLAYDDEPLMRVG